MSSASALGDAARRLRHGVPVRDRYAGFLVVGCCCRASDAIAWLRCSPLVESSSTVDAQQLLVRLLWAGYVRLVGSDGAAAAAALATAAAARDEAALLRLLDEEVLHQALLRFAVDEDAIERAFWGARCALPRSAAAASLIYRRAIKAGAGIAPSPMPAPPSPLSRRGFTPQRSTPPFLFLMSAARHGAAPSPPPLMALPAPRSSHHDGAALSTITVGTLSGAEAATMHPLSFRVTSHVALNSVLLTAPLVDALHALLRRTATRARSPSAPSRATGLLLSRAPEQPPSPSLPRMHHAGSPSEPLLAAADAASAQRAILRLLRRLRFCFRLLASPTTQRWQIEREVVTPEPPASSSDACPAAQCGWRKAEWVPISSPGAISGERSRIRMPRGPASVPSPVSAAHDAGHAWGTTSSEQGKVSVQRLDCDNVFPVVRTRATVPVSPEVVLAGSWVCGGLHHLPRKLSLMTSMASPTLHIFRTLQTLSTPSILHSLARPNPESPVGHSFMWGQHGYSGISRFGGRVLVCSP